jgi:tetratricopeptide (TPR) repeat protein
MTLRSTLALLVLVAVHAGAQQKFTTQVMVVPAFQGADRGLASKGSDIVRDRVAGAFQKNELRVVSGGDMDDWLRLSGFEQNSVLSDGELGELAKKFRADERIIGTVTRTNGRVRIDVKLSLVRDLRMMQPISGEGATVNEAAEAVARDAIAARRQFVPLRLCENSAREGKPAAAVAAAAQGIAVYTKAVPTRMCLLNALSKLDVKADSIIAVAQAVLQVEPTNSVALEDLAQALDFGQKSAEAAPVWVRLLATDTLSEAMVEKVVNALAREGNAKIAVPLIDRGTDQHPDNLPLLKLRWLVHLAEKDWKGAVAAGELLLAKDLAAQADADFYSRLSLAFREDSQPARALSTAALGVSKFPKDAPLYVTYLQLLRVENAAALPRGLAAFPNSAELHVLAAQSLKSSGNATAAMEETKRALAANPKLPHGFLQLAQLEIDAGQADSALTAIDQAAKNGESSATVAQFALARGNTLYKAAQASQKRDDFQRAIKFLAVSEHIAPSPEAKFLLGASSLSVSQSAATDAAPAKSCELSKLADSSLTDAEINLVSGGSVAPDAAKQFLDYVAKLRPYVADQVKSFCER